MPCHVVRGVRCQADQCSSQVCHFSQSVSGGIWQPQRGASTEPLKRETVKRGGKKSHQSCWEWQCHRFGDKNKPNYPRGKALWWRLLAEMSGSPAAFTCPGIPTSVWGMEKEGVTPKLCKHDFLNPTWYRINTMVTRSRVAGIIVRCIPEPWYEIPTLDKLALPRSMRHLG